MCVFISNLLEASNNCGPHFSKVDGELLLSVHKVKVGGTCTAEPQPGNAKHTSIGRCVCVCVCGRGGGGMSSNTHVKYVRWPRVEQYLCSVEFRSATTTHAQHPLFSVNIRRQIGGKMTNEVVVGSREKV